MPTYAMLGIIASHEIDKQGTFCFLNTLVQSSVIESFMDTTDLL